MYHALFGRISKYTDFAVILHGLLKFMFSEKATKLCEIFTLLLSYAVPVKSKLNILQNFVAFSEYVNFIMLQYCSHFDLLLESTLSILWPVSKMSHIS